eukprot:1157957-Pelagomonas_calceolata.AAC.6
MEENDILMGLTDSLRSQLTLYVYKGVKGRVTRAPMTVVLHTVHAGVPGSCAAALIAFKCFD